MAFALQDPTDFVREAKSSFASPVQEPSVDVDSWHRYDDVTRATSTDKFSTHAARRDEESRDMVQPRQSWEDAFDKVFAEELELV